MKSIAVATLAMLAAVPALAQQGVSPTEIVVGTAQDLSGPIVNFSKAAVNGMRMRVDEVNAAGGINGRKLRLVVEDHGYDPKKAVLAAQKMVQQDKIFAALGSIGTPTAMAAMSIYLDNKVAHLFPLSGAREMFEPTAPLKFSFAAPYFDQIRAGIKRLTREKGLKKVCTVYQDDDFGLEVMRGAEAGLKDLGTAYAERTTYKRGATDFSSQVAKMKEAGCDGVVMGTIIRETIGVIGTARKLDWNPVFVGTTASYSEIIHKLGGAVVNGFYDLHGEQSLRRRPESTDQGMVRCLQGQVQRGPDGILGLWLADHQPVCDRRDRGRQGPDAGLAQQGDRDDEVSRRRVRRRRADLLGHQAARLRPRDAVPDPGRQVEVGVGVSDELISWPGWRARRASRARHLFNA